MHADPGEPALPGPAPASAASGYQNMGPNGAGKSHRRVALQLDLNGARRGFVAVHRRGDEREMQRLAMPAEFRGQLRHKVSYFDGTNTGTDL
jgi:hypothetical protein